MSKYLSIIILLVGITIDILLMPNIYIHSGQTIIALLLGILCTILAILVYKHAYTNWQRLCIVLGGITNTIPVLYFYFLLLNRELFY